jgi:hypothetical protein
VRRADRAVEVGFHSWAAAANESHFRREQLRRGLLRYRRALLTSGLAHWSTFVRAGRLSLMHVSAGPTTSYRLRFPSSFIPRSPLVVNFIVAITLLFFNMYEYQ